MKKRSMKCFSTITLALLLTLSLFVSAATSVEASESQVTEDEKIEFLRSIGTPEEILADYNPKLIDDFYNTLSGKDVRFAGSDSQIVEIKENDSKARGNIPTSQLKLTVATYDMMSNGVVSGVDVGLGYEWLRSPICHMDDALTFSWDDNTFYDAGFYATANCTYDGIPITLENINAPAIASSNSIGWYSSIREPQPGLAEKHYGGGQVLLRPRYSFSSSTDLNSKMYLTYAHQIIGFGISFGITDIGVSITAGNYDKQALSYTYH